ncbi:prolipoprotein diacylglyceryl transferase [Botrimarina hoheduenensis]|uniref:Phosphatidylglycerol--prolipoprotein diacylglyceryl transferase n=1 Tax=Botrimarina hoheduenensis TaxID=2528000 RepID=A0A5C5W6L3_9BACT|nr:prolipoprotein diacylglyceryl transferase family protein [Botrimarina hoheduenensis]TWT46558.1 Prolipoprotein diacylglyceryl transferase [Botrimarina hoheduenensis]
MSPVGQQHAIRFITSPFKHKRFTSMRSELFRIPLEWGGVPLFGGGALLVALLLGVGLYALWSKRAHGAQADLWGLLPPTGVAAAILLLTPRLAPAGVPIRAYGVLLVAAIAVGLVMSIHRARSRGIDADTVLSLALWWLFIPGIVGARLFFVIEYWEVRYAALPWREAVFDAFRFTEGGLVVYGSLIGATLGFLAFAWRYRLPALALADLIAPSLLAGLAIGRVGCLMNGCCFGGPCELPWAVTFPPTSPPFEEQLARGELHGVRLRTATDGQSLTIDLPAEHAGERVLAVDGVATRSAYEAAAGFRAAYAAGRPVELRLARGETLRLPASTLRRSRPVHPTQIYSTINAALLAWLLWTLYPLRRRDGTVLLTMLTLYPIGRFLLEMIRIDEADFLGTGMSISQNLSLVLLAAAALGWWVVLTRPAALWPGISQGSDSKVGTPAPTAA